MIVVSNEVGMGLHPNSALGRIYRDALGRANQRLATHADAAYLLVAGIPLDLHRLEPICLMEWPNDIALAEMSDPDETYY